MKVKREIGNEKTWISTCLLVSTLLIAGCESDFFESKSEFVDSLGASKHFPSEIRPIDIAGMAVNMDNYTELQMKDMLARTKDKYVVFDSEFLDVALVSESKKYEEYSVVKIRFRGKEDGLFSNSKYVLLASSLTGEATCYVKDDRLKELRRKPKGEQILMAGKLTKVSASGLRVSKCSVIDDVYDDLIVGNSKTA